MTERWVTTILAQEKSYSVPKQVQMASLGNFLILCMHSKAGLEAKWQGCPLSQAQACFSTGLNRVKHHLNQSTFWLFKNAAEKLSLPATT